MEQLKSLLDQHRDELHAWPGVVGTGIGLTGKGGGTSKSGEAGQFTIQIYVVSSTHSERTLSAARALLGDAPVEVIVTGEATAAG